MIDPRIIIKANYNRTSITIRVTAIDSPDWVDIVGTRIELFRDAGMVNRFVNNSTNHYKVRAYLENEVPNQTIYGRVTLTKDDNTTLVKTFNFVTPYPVLGTVKDEENTQYITSIRKMDKNGNLSPRNYANKAVSDVPLHIDIMADEGGEMVVGNQWTTPILVQNITQGTAQVEVAQSTQATVAVNTGDIIRVTESTQKYTFARFQNYQQPLCKGVSAHIVAMPPIEDFLMRNTSYPLSSYFFYYFNNNGTLTSLPEGSFDLRGLPAVQSSYGFFYYFNASGALTSLPEGSFDTSSFTQMFSDSFTNFNSYGALTSLPEGSFDFDNLTAQCSFQNFNQNGALQSLPEGSFGFSNVASLGSFAFARFNSSGRIASLPDGSFHFKKNSTAGGTSCFVSFNRLGSLVSFPEHALNFTLVADSINYVGFDNFNDQGALTSLPSGSFHFASSITSISDFNSFNKQGALTALPEGSFNTDSVTNLGYWAFSGFNKSGALTSLPEGSFNFDNVTTISGQDIFSEFNRGGALKTLPKGSFSLKNLTTLGGNYTNGLAAYFNFEGALEYLPIGAFSIDGLLGNYNNQGFGLFNGNADANTAGKLTKSDTDYNARFISLRTAAYDFSYYDPSTQTSFKEAVSPGNPVKYYQADYFTVTYTASQAYTTDLASTYLSGQTITFTATAADPEYLATPTITTAGGVTVTVTDNGDDTYTFKMPQDDIDVTFAVSLRPAVITLIAEEAGTIQIANKWTTPVLVKNVTQGTSPVTVTSSTTTSLSVDLDDEITVTESSGSVTFRNWANYSTGFATGVLCRISEMPPMNRFTNTSEGTGAKAYFFYYFCAGANGKGITSLPAGSFDTSTITGVTNNYFFSDFNKDGLLTSLPAGSFDISNITRAVGVYFFDYFNYNGKLTSLPTGSFDTSNITTVQGGHFFEYFNGKGELTSLPAGSFDISGISGSAPGNFFTGFNSQGKLTSLPVGSFDTSNITGAGMEFFASFNSQGKLTSLPVGSFDTSNITTQYRRFFQSFNESGELTSLPDGSFDISGLSNLSPSSSSGTSFFHNFNKNGKLTSLPAGSFDTSNITSMGEFGFNGFNYQGKLTSLPIGSFDISNIAVERGGFFAGFNYGGELTSLPDGSFRLSSNLTSTSSNFFSSFNGGTSSARGKLTSLPAGSFDTSHITRAWTGFFSDFNRYGNLTSLPVGSFNISNVAGEVGSQFFYEFNHHGALTSLPVGSFDTGNITQVSSNFFANFNYQGALTSLPVGSFDTSNVTRAWDNFFANFNYKGEITALPAGSFNTRNITTFYPNPTPLFSQFNTNGGKLEKDTTNYNPDFINPDTPDITAYYWNAQSQASFSGTIVQGAPFYYKTT